MLWTSLLGLILNLTFLVLSAPLVTGCLRWVKARLQRRQGPSILQPYRDFWKLWQVHPRQHANGSWVFAVAPYVILICYILAGAILPVLFLPDATPVLVLGISVRGDLLLIIYLLGLAKFVSGLGAMDSGAAFGHMGTSRSMFIHVLAEPGLVISIAALALYWKTTDLPAIIIGTQAAGPAGVLLQPSLLLVLFSMVILMLAEGERLPFDNPTTHLELTMRDRATFIEYEGRQFAAIEAGEAIKKLVLFTLFIDLFIPGFLSPLSFNFAALLSPVIYIVKLGCLILGLAVWELLQGQFSLRDAILPAVVAVGLALVSIAYNVMVHFIS